MINACLVAKVFIEVRKLPLLLLLLPLLLQSLLSILNFGRPPFQFKLLAVKFVIL
jgi:hypothetical protein